MSYLVSVFTFGAIWAILVVSLNVLVGYAGQVSLGHAALFGIGAYTMALATTRYELPFLAGVVLAIIVTAVLGGILGLPSLRVQHDFLVLATIGFNFIVSGMFSYVDFLGGALGIVGIPPPAIGGMSLRGTSYLLVCLVALAVVAWGSLALQRTWGGLGLMALREDQTAAESIGVGHARYKISAFVLSGAVAGLGGGLYAPFVGNVFPDRFSFIESIILMSMLVFGGIGNVWGAIVGGFTLKALPEYLRFGGTLRFALYGAILVLVILLQPEGLLGDDSWLRRRFRQLRARVQRGARPAVVGREVVAGGKVADANHQGIDAVGGAEAAAGAEAMGATPRSRVIVGDVEEEALLAASDLVVEFDGLRALDGANISVRRGEVVGLIGPNGAGKTTLFNAITGSVRLLRGHIRLGGRAIHGWPPHRVAQQGVARTFQVVRPFATLDVRTNVMSGMGAATYPRLAAFRQGWLASRPRAQDLAADVGLGGRLEATASELPIGLLRRLEIGRAVALDPTVVLLDEPAAGLTSAETQELSHLVEQLANTGHAVILVEHNMTFAMELCDRIVVLAAGRVLAEGTPDEVRRDHRVVEVYLGSPT